MSDIAEGPDVMLYAEDLRVGDTIDLGPYAVSEQEIIDFGRRWDPLPIHVDPAAAAALPFGSLIGSGVHTLAIYSSLISPAFRARLAILAGKGIDRMRLPNPVRPDSVLTLRVEVVEVVPGPRYADVRTHAVMTDQGARVVLDLTSVLVVQTRPTAVTHAPA